MSKLKVRTTPDPILREKSRKLSKAEIKSDEIKKLVQDIKDTILSGEYGVGMSAVQVGQPLAVTVIMIRPTPTRPNLEPFNKVYFNPEIVKTKGDAHLNATGIEQAKQVAERLKNEKVDVIFTSPYNRALDTTQEIAKYHQGVPVIRLEELRERGCGATNVCRWLVLSLF